MPRRPTQSRLKEGELALSVSNDDLDNDSVTISAGTNLVGGGTVELGSSTTLDVSGVATEELITATQFVMGGR